MPDVLIRNLAVDDLVRLDAQANRLGLSRADFLRRHLHQQAQRSVEEVTVTDLSSLAVLIADVADPKVMDAAWS